MGEGNGREINYQVLQSASDKATYTVLPRGQALGIVSDPKTHVFFLIRRLHRPKMISSGREWSPDELWHISEATVRASGDWEGAVCGYPDIEFDAPDYEYWEIMAIATNTEDAVTDKIVPQMCAIRDEDLKGLGIDNHLLENSNLDAETNKRRELLHRSNARSQAYAMANTFFRLR